MKDKNSRKYVIVPQRFHPSQIGDMSMFCITIKKNKLDDLFGFIVNNGGRVVSAIPCAGVSRSSIYNVLDGYKKDFYLVVSMCQVEITETLMMSICREFEINKNGNGKAFVIDILGYMGAKGPFVEWGEYGK